MISEKLRRLRQMSAPEVKFRIAQRWRIQKEQWGPSGNGAGSSWVSYWNPEAVHHSALQERLKAEDAAGAAALLPAYFERRKTPLFFFEAAQRDKIRMAHAAAFPERLNSLRAEADAVCAHRFRIFAYPEISAGPKIPWRRDLVHGKEAPAEHWARIPYLDFQRAGDSKVVWEPNRHQHFVTLGQAYFLTRDERYAKECFEQWDDWLRENPCGVGINWSSSLELAFRLWSWCWALHFFQGSAVLNGTRLSMIAQAIAQHANFILQNLSTYFSPNTHLLGEGFALFVVGLLYPELHGAAEWRESGRAILLEQMQRQVRADGWHVEQSSYYHRYATDFFQCAAILAERNGCPFPASYKAKLARMYEVILHTQLPSGLQPMLGDADGGRLLSFSAPPAPQQSHDQRGALSNAAVYFSRPNFRGGAGILHEDTFWLLGPDSGERWRHLPSTSSQLQSAAFRDAGCIVMRSDEGESAHVLLFDTGPQGLVPCAHGHADALSIVCSAEGEDWLVDPGTFVYTSSYQWRRNFSGTSAHNTVVIDGLDQAEPVDFFKWRAIPNVKFEKWITSPTLDYAVGSHDGYVRLAQGATHRRRVVFVKPGYWIVTDELVCTGEHQADFMFHFAPGSRLTLEASRCIARRGDKEFLLASTASELDWRIVEADENQGIGWHSRDYGDRVPSPVLIARCKVPSHACVHWLLFPSPGSVAPNLSGTDTLISLEFSDGAKALLQREAAIAGNPQMGSDGELLFRQFDSSSSLREFVLFEGCCVWNGTQRVFEADGMMDWFKATFHSNAVSIDGYPKRRLRIGVPGIHQVLYAGKQVPFQRHGRFISVTEW